MSAMTTAEIEALQPNYLGPTWRHKAGCYGRLEDHPDCEWDLPERTLGWQIAAWCTKYLTDLDQGRWTFTPEQLRFILWWYAVDDDGNFIYRTGVFQRLKGHGKDPLGAVMCTVEFVGPCRVKRDKHGNPVWGPDGNPIGIPHPRSWVQVAAVSKEQTKNTMTLFPALFSQRLIEEYGIKLGNELIRAERGRKRLEAVTSSYRALEGGRSTFVLLNETHHWVKGNNGDLMYETIDGNATKGDNRYLAITNAYLPGEDSVAERMRMAYEDIVEGRAPDIGFVYDSIEADPRTPLTPVALAHVLPMIRGDAVWLKVEPIIQSIQNTTISASRSRRMWLNQILADEDSVYRIDQLDAIIRHGAELRPGDRIVLGFDGGKRDDSTALVAIRVSDACAFLLAIWERPVGWPKDEPWEVPHVRVDSAVHDAFRLYDVAAMYADVAYWESYITKWNEAYGSSLVVKASPGNPIGWDMRSSQQRNTRAHERLMDAILKRNIYFDGDPTLKRHAFNARRRVNSYGVSFGKEDAKSPRKVDAYAAWMLAHEALTDLRTASAQKKPAIQGTGEGWFL